MNAGSQWRKWNFHVHTKGTNKNDLFLSPSMDEFFCVFYKKAFANKIQAIALTDYFSIDRYIESIEYKRDLENKVDNTGTKLFNAEELSFIKNIFIFPNVELRMLPTTDSSRLINIHCLFNPDYVNDLEHDFFSIIKNQEGYQMTRRGITMYGEHLSKGLSEKEQYKLGLERFVLSIEPLKEALKNERFRENTLLVVSNSNRDGASATQKHYDLFENETGSLEGIRQSIYHISDAIFSGNPKDVKYFLGKKSHGTEGYSETIHKKEIDLVIKERGSLKPCLVGCDAHTEEPLFSKFTWVKADLNFEGLRQICFEPESRVKVQTEKPDFKEEKLLIEKIKFISPGNVFSTKPIYFNPNLNVIIGGKSSGKSILLYAIAKSLSADIAVLKNDDESYKYDFDKLEKGVDFEVTTKGGFPQLLSRGEEASSILPEMKYIPQNYLVKLAEPDVNKKGKSLNKIVRDLIIEDNSSKDSYQNFIDKVVQNDTLRNAQIDLYFNTRKEIEELESELRLKSVKDVLEKNISSNIEKVEELSKSSGFTPAQVEEYKSIQDKLEINSVNTQNLNQDLSRVRSFNTDILSTISALKLKKDSLLNGLHFNGIKEFYTDKYLMIDNLISLAKEIVNSIEIETGEDGKRAFKRDNKFSEELTKINAEKNILNEQAKPFQLNDLARKAVDELNESISNDKKSLLDIKDLNKKIQEKKTLIDKTKAKIFNIYEASHKEYIDIVNSLKDRTAELEKDGLKIEGKARFNFPKLRREMINISDGRSASYNKYSLLYEENKSTNEVDFDFIMREVRLLFEAIISKKYILTNKTNMSIAVKTVLDDYFFDYWQINYKNDQLGEMSTGKASFVILMLIIGLSKSKAPILIDQPEDNLDNRSITTDLVNYLRDKKLDRQIIIVTHNANIVVNADAENIIVANQKGQNNESSTSPYRFDYINGAIESSYEHNPEETDILKAMGIRQHVADIVEGGKEAFIMREKKYRFK
ncbi:MAG: hypothetical protein EOP45_04370 [Sphingobacteriaceae bacterium]|nr:MAG: hypothetical protein EOP45_04370 [Sphingobacteriaceae bacterium]